jgi:hypothetical protein
MRMPAQKSVRYAMFGLLYLAQGAILSCYTALNALHLLSIAASMFAILMVIANIGTGVGLTIGGVPVDLCGRGVLESPRPPAQSRDLFQKMARGLAASEA